MDYSNIIKNPRITEKSTDALENNAYVFNVDNSATKKEIEKAIFAIYKVKPVKVNVVNYRAKATFFRGKQGTKSGGKKAIVFLKEGDKIELI